MVKSDLDEIPSWFQPKCVWFNLKLWWQCCFDLRMNDDSSSFLRPLWLSNFDVFNGKIGYDSHLRLFIYSCF